MVAINKILMLGCTGEECGGDNDICTDSRVHHRNAENRAPTTRNHRSAPNLGRWMEQEPTGENNPQEPGDEEPNEGNLKKIGSGFRANQIAQDFGYDNAENLKEAFGFDPLSQADRYSANRNVYVMGRGSTGVPTHVGPPSR